LHGAQVDPSQLQTACVRSGKLGGRARLPTSTKRREATLDALIPASLRALGAHLGTEQNPNADAWRAALKVLEMRFGPAPAEADDVSLRVAADDATSLSWQQMRSLAASLLTVTPNNDAVEIMVSTSATTTTT
jgi:hypothetical protein